MGVTRRRRVLQPPEPRQSRHPLRRRRGVHIGLPPARRSYLYIPNIIEAGPALRGGRPFTPANGFPLRGPPTSRRSAPTTAITFHRASAGTSWMCVGDKARGFARLMVDAGLPRSCPGSDAARVRTPGRGQSRSPTRWAIPRGGEGPGRGRRGGRGHRHRGAKRTDLPDGVPDDDRTGPRNPVRQRRSLSPNTISTGPGTWEMQVAVRRVRPKRGATSAERDCSLPGAGANQQKTRPRSPPFARPGRPGCSTISGRYALAGARGVGYNRGPGPWSSWWDDGGHVTFHGDQRPDPGRAPRPPRWCPASTSSGSSSGSRGGAARLRPAGRPPSPGQRSSAGSTPRIPPRTSGPTPGAPSDVFRPPKRAMGPGVRLGLRGR